MAPLMTDGERLAQQRSVVRAGRERDLSILARAMLEHPAIERIELFGSFARRDSNPYFSDYDLIIVVDEATAEEWLNELRRHHRYFTEAFGDDTYTGLKEVRFLVAERLLGSKLPVSIWASIDLFVFPPNWQDEKKLERLQAAGSHRDPDFMRNLARDAITFDEAMGSFPWPTQQEN